MSEETTPTFNIQHSEYIKELSINPTDLPKEIKGKIKSFNMIYGRYKKNPTEKYKKTLTVKDIEICDLIENWRQRNFPDEEIEEDTTPIVETVEPTHTPKTTEEDTTPIVETVELTHTQTKDEDKLVAEIKDNIVNGRIEISKLKIIIGKTPNYPIQKVGNMRLQKVFLSPTYRVLP